MNDWRDRKGRDCQVEPVCRWCESEYGGTAPKAGAFKLIAGPKGVFICDECTALCVDILVKESTPPYTVTEGRDKP